MQLIVCPLCRGSLSIYSCLSVCDSGHEFPVIRGILDLALNVVDQNIINEQHHWNTIAERGRMKIEPNQYFSEKVVEDYRNEFEKALLRQWPNVTDRTLSIVDIGCGSGSALRYLNRLEFLSVDYVGIDISEEAMQIAVKQPRPANWNMQFVKSSANLDIFRNDSLDLVISASSLHHLNLTCVLKWTSKSLKKNGLLVLNEPSARNPFAKIGRKLIKGFHTQGEKPINPNTLRLLALKFGLELIYEKGLHFFSGPLQYLVGMLKLPPPLAFFLFYFSKFFDSCIASPSWSYSFVQAYKKK